MSSVGSPNALPKTGFVLDSFAVLALLEAEKGSGDVAALLRPGPDLLLMTYVNLGEVVYTVIRERGQSRADAALVALEGSRITFVPADRTLTLAAARLKAGHRLSYADAFCAALSQLSGFPVVTGDPEFLQLDGLISIRWIG
jgi:PIN domain nuclease of toxin-antitoxin system